MRGGERKEEKRKGGKGETGVLWAWSASALLQKHRAPLVFARVRSHTLSLAFASWTHPSRGPQRQSTSWCPGASANVLVSRCLSQCPLSTSWDTLGPFHLQSSQALFPLQKMSPVVPPLQGLHPLSSQPHSVSVTLQLSSVTAFPVLVCAASASPVCST